MSEMDTAVARLSNGAGRVPALEFKSSTGDQQPGLYTWWVGDSGRAQLSIGLGAELGPLIYGGQAGATKWPSGTRSEATIRSRIVTNHLGSSIGASTFRWTLASLLTGQLDLRATGPKKLDRAGERTLTEWMLHHLSIVTFGYADRDRLAALEDKVIAGLNPPLNLRGVAATPERKRLSDLRRQLGRSAADDPVELTPQKPESPTQGEAPVGRVKLHEELVAILETTRGWMTTTELAEKVARRARYVKRDGTSDVSAFQVHGRTKNYPHLFERDGSRVRLV